MCVYLDPGLNSEAWMSLFHLPTLVPFYHIQDLVLIFFFFWQEVQFSKFKVISLFLPSRLLA